MDGTTSNRALRVRLLGLIFIFTGDVMTVFGLFTQGSAIYDKSMGVNLNMGWGDIRLIFVAVMFFFGAQAEVAGRSGGPRPWGRGKGTKL